MKKKIKLIETEKIITTSSNGEITLTNHRLRKVVGSSGNGMLTSILLRNISSIYMISKRKNIYLVLGILLLGTALFLIAENETEIAFVAGAIGIVFIIFFILSKTHFISVASGGGAKIHLFTKGMKYSSILDFIDKIEAAIIDEPQINKIKDE